MATGDGYTAALLLVYKYRARAYEVQQLYDLLDIIKGFIIIKRMYIYANIYKYGVVNQHMHINDIMVSGVRVTATTFVYECRS